PGRRPLAIPNLVKHLSLEVSTIDTLLLRAIFQLFPALVELNLRDHASGRRANLTDDDLQYISECTQLQKLSLVRTAGKFAGSDFGVMYLATGARHTLEQVTISGMPKVRNNFR